MTFFYLKLKFYSRRCRRPLKLVGCEKNQSAEFATVYEMLASMNLKLVVLQAVLF